MGTKRVIIPGLILMLTAFLMLGILIFDLAGKEAGIGICTVLILAWATAMYLWIQSIIRKTIQQLDV